MTVAEALKKCLNELEAMTNSDWMQHLSDRKKRELAFHDLDRDRSRVAAMDATAYKKSYGNKKFYGATRESVKYVSAWLQKNVPGKVFLDYACGDGKQTLNAARMGATIAIGIDLSRISVENARADARNNGLENVTCFVQGDAENTLLPDNSIDIILCSGMLHHLDLSYALPEMRRILAPGGRILAVEALNYNPIIKLYRLLTPQMRTSWEKEHILSLRDVDFASRFFTIEQIRYWHIASIFYPYAKWMLPAMETIDSALTRLPLIQKMAWQFTFEMIKEAEE